MKQPKADNGMSPDGSLRSFSRTLWQGMPAVRIEPSPGDEGIREAQSFYLIGRHLCGKGVPVPEIYSFDRATGVLVVQDLGHELFFHKALQLAGNTSETALMSLYQQALELLAFMQTRGGEGFDVSWCWQEPFYDASVAYHKETTYFLGSFVTGYMGIADVSRQVEKELDGLAARVEAFECRRFFMHRDFQSRNIMMQTGSRFSMALIDFQAGRLGPLCYDVASLLNDPYVDLGFGLRRELMRWYLDRLTSMGLAREAEEASAQWPVLSALRLMQALGAFGFLTSERGRNFFHSYVAPALRGLVWILEEEFQAELPATLNLCHAMEKMLSDRQIRADSEK